MKLKRLLALLMAFGLVAAACGGSDDGDAGDDTDTSTDDAMEDGDDAMEDDDDAMEDDDDAMEDDGDAPAGDIATDFGVSDNTIRVGINGDLSGPFAALVSEIVEAQEVYWEWVNDNGGINGYMVETVVLDSGYATDKGIENYEEFAQESD